MMSNLATYLPQDRRRALAHGETLPDRAHGSVLFADISGFTPLTETLRNQFGSRRGAEELTKHLDAVYTALIEQVQQHGGSVIGFAGDAITCWFDDSDGVTPPIVVACGLALQEQMQAFAAIRLSVEETVTLELKVAIATGEVRRLVVGNSQYRYLDTLAGETVNRTAVAEHLANRGDIIIDQATAHALGETITMQEWRTDEESQVRYGMVKELTIAVTLPNEPEPTALDDEQLRPWVHPTIYEREQAGTAVFLAEFRPCVALFIRFTGIDYDSDYAGMQLDSFIQQVQRLATQYEGTLLHLIIGDKGSYLYLNFGALSAHEDEARRAVKTATAVREMAESYDWLNPLQMGLAQGVMWTGTYGGATRRTYSAFGDDVNLAARLMSTAVEGEILLSQAVQKSIAQQITVSPSRLIQLKGKAEPILVFSLAEEQQHRSLHLPEPTYTLPMVGRQAELQQVAAKLALTQQGQAQVVSIVAEAGMGKSRLAAEVIRLAGQSGFARYGGACQADGLNTAYLVWKPIWSAIFELEADLSPEQQIARLQSKVATYTPERLPSLPLLGRLLDLPIPDNEFTQTLDPQDRKGARHALLEDCLKAASNFVPLLIVIEDLHWIDALSDNLLEQLVRSTTRFPICFLLVYRPLETSVSPHHWLADELPHFTHIVLSELNTAEATQIIQAKLAQLYGTPPESVPPSLVEMLLSRTQGNPFYLEELLNFWRDRHLDPSDPAILETIELPDSLHSLILSRIDQLSQQEKTTLRLASIIGRLFRAKWLIGYYPELGELPQVKRDLEQLNALDITPLDTPEPELRYLFKHIITHEVTYENLPFATRTRLHGQLAHYLESISAPLDTIAHHYGQSDDVAKKRLYFQKAADAAQAAFANADALNYLARLLPLVDDPATQSQLYRQQSALWELLGRYDEAEISLKSALILAQQIADEASIGDCQLALGKLCLERGQGQYHEAQSWFEQALTHLNDPVGQAKAHFAMSDFWARQSDFQKIQQALKEGITLLEGMEDKQSQALVLEKKGELASCQGEYAQAFELYQQHLALCHEIGDKRQITKAMYLLAGVAWRESDYAMAQQQFEACLSLYREMGDKGAIAAVHSFLADIAGRQGIYETEQTLCQQAFEMHREMGNKAGMAAVFNSLGVSFSAQGNYVSAREMYEQCLVISRQLGSKMQLWMTQGNLAIVAHAEGNYGEGHELFGQALAACREMGSGWGVANTLLNWGNLLVEEGEEVDRARNFYQEALQLSQQRRDKTEISLNLSGLAAAATLEQDWVRAVRLLATAEALRLTAGFLREPIEDRVYQQALTAVQSHLSPEEFKAAWVEGEAMNVEQAIAYALDETNTSE